MTTWQGLCYVNRLADSSFQRETMPIAVATATFLLALGLWLPLFKWYPKLDEKRKRIVLYFVVPFGITTIFFSSTVWSIIGIGGVPAMTQHMTVTVEQAEGTLTSLTARVEREAALKAPVTLLSNQFATLSQLEERKGAFTTFQGVGDVSIQLQSLSETLHNLGNQIGENSSERRQDLADARETLEKLRKTVDDPEISMSNKSIQFSRQLTGLNQTFERVASSRIVEVIKSVSRDLDSLSALQAPQGDTKLADAQRSALQNLGQTVATAKDTMAKFLQDISSADDVKLKNLTAISPSVAVRRYWSSILPEISASITLDFFPAVLFILLTITVDVRKKEEEAEEIL